MIFDRNEEDTELSLWLVKKADYVTDESQPSESWTIQSRSVRNVMSKIQSETAIDYACDQDRLLRERFPQIVRSQREEVLLYELEEIFESRQLRLDESQDEIETARVLSQREKRELFRQLRNLTYSQYIDSARGVRHVRGRRGELRLVLNEMRCLTYEARSSPLSTRPSVSRCLRFNQCIEVDLMDLEVRDGLLSKSSTWFVGTAVVKSFKLCGMDHTLYSVMSEFKAVWGKYCAWSEILDHDQDPEFMWSEFQNPAGGADVLILSIDSQSPWQNDKKGRAGQSFKHQLWDMDEECHIEGRREFEATIAEWCAAKKRYCNRSGISAHQDVFGSSLRLSGSLLRDGPIDRQLLSADPNTDFQRINDMRSAA